VTPADSGSADPAPNRLDAQGRKTGRWEEPDPHGGTMTGDYVDGERHGHWKHRASDGSLRSEGEFDAGVLHGPWVWFRATGGMLQRGGFDHAEKHGLWERWSAAGVLIDSGEWVNGQKSGSWTYFNPDGTVKKVAQHRPRPR
jgi:antitoxin component YwqK of YwqJK toxin-antitoxin module